MQPHSCLSGGRRVSAVAAAGLGFFPLVVVIMGRGISRLYTFTTNPTIDWRNCSNAIASCCACRLDLIPYFGYLACALPNLFKLCSSPSDYAQVEKLVFVLLNCYCFNHQQTPWSCCPFYFWPDYSSCAADCYYLILELLMARLITESDSNYSPCYYWTHFAHRSIAPHSAAWCCVCHLPSPWL